METVPTGHKPEFFYKANIPCVVFLQLVSIEYGAYYSSAYFHRMKYTAMKILITLLFLISSGCSTIQSHPDNKEVRLIFYNEVNVFRKNNEVNCEYIGPLVSSEGHWYTFLFISNANLTNGAINDMYNKANDIGANVVYIDSNIDFGSSVTLLGQAYVCT